VAGASHSFLTEQVVPKVLRYKAEELKRRDESITYYKCQETRTGINRLLMCQNG